MKYAIFHDDTAPTEVKAALRNIDRCLTERGHVKKTLTDDVGLVFFWGDESGVKIPRAKQVPFFNLLNCTGIGVAISTFPGKIRVQAFEDGKKVFFDVPDEERKA